MMVRSGTTMYVPDKMRKQVKKVSDWLGIGTKESFNLLANDMEEFDLFGQMKTKRNINKKGSIEGLFSMIFTIFVLSIILYAIYFAGSAVITAMQGVSEISSVPLANDVLTEGTGWLQKTDIFTIILTIGFYLVIIVTSYLIPVSTMNSPIFIFSFIFVEMLSGIFSYVWFKFTTTTSSFDATLLAMPITDHILTFLPLYILVAGVLSMVLTYGRGESSSL